MTEYRVFWKIAEDTGKSANVLAYKLYCPDVPDDVLRKFNKNNVLSRLGDMLGTCLGHGEVIVGTLRTSSPPLKGGMSCPQTLSPKVRDYSELEEKEFLGVVNEISCLGELEGLANRRRILNRADLPTWKQWQKDIILERKWRLENECDATRKNRGTKRRRNVGV